MDIPTIPLSPLSPPSSLPSSPSEPVFLPDWLASKEPGLLFPREARRFPTGKLDPQILDFQSYRASKNQRSRNDRRQNRSNMSYLPIKFEKTLADFPTNQELEVYNAENPDAPQCSPNQAVMRTRLKGDDELYLTELQAAKKVDTGTGKVSDALEGIDFMLEVLVRSLVSWTFYDYDLAQPVAITKDAIKQLYKEDFDYLVKEATPIINKMFGVTDDKVPSGQEDLAPHNSLDEAEKNLSEPGSTPASEPSASEPSPALI